MRGKVRRRTFAREKRPAGSGPQQSDPAGSENSRSPRGRESGGGIPRLDHVLSVLRRDETNRRTRSGSRELWLLAPETTFAWFALLSEEHERTKPPGELLERGTPAEPVSQWGSARRAGGDWSSPGNVRRWVRAGNAVGDEAAALRTAMPRPGPTVYPAVGLRPRSRSARAGAQCFRTICNLRGVSFSGWW
jgi:hypothetical protein